MSEIERIQRQMRRAFEGGAWHGPALLEVLEGADAAIAAARPIPGAHGIWEIVLHLSGTQALMLRRLRGDATELTAEEDWPALPADPTEGAWRETLDRLRRLEAELRSAVEAFPEDRLGSPLVPGGSSAYDNFHGHVQHTLYHAGQVVMLRKTAGSGR